jgi:hypothetical protein
LTVDFDDPVGPGAEADLEFAFRSQPRRTPATDSFGISPEAAVANAGDLWYPFPADGSFEAPGLLEIEMPAEWTAAATGEPAEPTSAAGGKKSVVQAWRIVGTSGRSFAAGVLAVESLQREGLRIRLLYPPAGFDRPAALAGRMAEMLAPLIEHFGAFPWDPYQVVLLPPSTTTVGGAPAEGLFVGSSRALQAADIFELVFTHESSHAWWWFSARPEEGSPLLLSEGLAQYGYILSLEARRGRAEALDFLNNGLPGLPFASAFGYGEMWEEGRDQPLAEVRGGTPGDDSFRLAWVKAPGCSTCCAGGSVRTCRAPGVQRRLQGDRRSAGDCL